MPVEEEAQWSLVAGMERSSGEAVLTKTISALPQPVYLHRNQRHRISHERAGRHRRTPLKCVAALHRIIPPRPAVLPPVVLLSGACNPRVQYTSMRRSLCFVKQFCRSNEVLSRRRYAMLPDGVRKENGVSHSQVALVFSRERNEDRRNCRIARSYPERPESLDRRCLGHTFLP